MVFFILSFEFVLNLPLAYGDWREPVVDAAAYTEEHNANGAESKRQLGVEVALERGQGRLCRDDVHRLDNEQIVVETHYGIDQGYEHY